MMIFIVREIASLIGEDPGNVSRELRVFEAEGVLTSQVRAGAKFYKLDKGSELVRDVECLVMGDE